MAASDVKNPFQNDKWWCLTDAKMGTFSYMWTIYNFSLQNQKRGEELKSSIFSVRNDEKTKLQLSVYPRGHDTDENEVEEVYLAVYLYVVSSYRPQVRADFRISILDAKNNKTKSRKVKETIDTQWRKGWQLFFQRKEVMDDNNGLLPDDTFTLFCEGSILVEDTVHTSGKSHPVKQFKVPECDALCEFGQLLKSCKLADVTISAGDEKIQAHKAILAARSPVFSAMFNCELEEAKKNRVEIPDLEPNVIKEMLCFMYTGQAPNLQKMARDLIMAADKYDLSRLKVMCAESLFTTLTTDNAMEILILADRHGEEQLKDQTMEFINTYLKHVIETTGYKTMIDSHPHLIEGILRASIVMQENSGCKSHEVYNQQNIL